ncbi:helix-turn-helix transcriptional regulator [Campylobacter corcagiensis]|nr:helix-turn-helix transcriptional regulator [Campylobacter corcagiensis]
MYKYRNFLYNITMEVSDIFNILHNAVESKYMGKKISQSAMAKKLGVSMRTYQDWRLGNSRPGAVMAVFTMLSELDDDESAFVLNKIKKLIKKDGYAKSDS